MRTLAPPLPIRRTLSSPALPLVASGLAPSPTALFGAAPHVHPLAGVMMSASLFAVPFPALSNFPTAATARARGTRREPAIRTLLEVLLNNSQPRMMRPTADEGESLLCSLQWTLGAKIALTIALWQLPSLLLPVSAMVWLGFPRPEPQVWAATAGHSLHRASCLVLEGLR